VSYSPKRLTIRTLQALLWRLWHGQVQGAREAVKRIEKLLRAFDINFSLARTTIPAKRLQTAVRNLSDYI
jgi:hypothetical protein